MSRSSWQTNDVHSFFYSRTNLSLLPASSSLSISFGNKEKERLWPGLLLLLSLCVCLCEAPKEKFEPNDLHLLHLSCRIASHADLSITNSTTDDLARTRKGPSPLFFFRFPKSTKGILLLLCNKDHLGRFFPSLLCVLSGLLAPFDDSTLIRRAIGF